MLDHFSIPAEKRLDLYRQILYCSDYDVSSMFICLAIVFLTLIDGECSFSSLKKSCRKTHHGHIPGWQCQDSSGSNCERIVGREHELSFSHMNWQNLAPLSTDLKFIESLYRVLDSCIVNTRPWPKTYAPLDGNNITAFSIKRCIHFWWRSCMYFGLFLQFWHEMV